MTKKQGKFIVIDGTDGSGKATQTKMLVERLEKNGYPVEMADFPQYGEKSAGMVENYLNGKYGTAEDVGPFRASIFYAIDRYDASFKIKKWLREGKTVVSNRYVTANMGHQGGKIKEAKKRQEYFKWLYDLEYRLFDIPRPDINIILHVDALAAQKLVDDKAKREYINGRKRDLHEKDINHLRRAEQVYLEIARQFSDIELIECSPQNKILPREQINDLLWQRIKKHLESEQINNNKKELITEQNFLFSTKAEGKDNLASIRFERISKNAILPTRAYQDDIGFDLYAIDYYTLLPGERAGIKTGLKLALPKGYAGLIWDRSSSAKNGIHTLGGVFDPGFRGEMIIHLINLSADILQISPGKKIAQLLIQKTETPQIIEAKIDNDSERNEKSHGSSGDFFHQNK